MDNINLIFIPSAFPTERDRMLFIYQRDGIDAMVCWVEQTYCVYRQHLKHGRLNNTMTTHFRIEFIKSCIDFRAFLRLYRKNSLTQYQSRGNITQSY